ncbi:MAG: RNA polymerase sigma factor [Clostridiales bacterium]|nr:RNA polymerase sigma factor [Clostridiales bacterium]
MEEQTMYADPPQGPLPLNEAMDRLPADMRVLISLHYLGGFGLRDIASLLKIPLGTVKTRVSRARKQLSVYLSEEWEDDLQ